MDNAPKVTFVLTHGRDQVFEIPETEARQWIDALRWGLTRVGVADSASIPVDFAFYGDLWRQDENGMQSQSTLDGIDREDISTALAGDMLEASGMNLIIPEANTGWDTLAYIMTALDQHLHIGVPILSLFLQDLAQYFAVPDLRQKTVERVASTIRNAAGPVVLLAHSMGTVVGYDLLIQEPDLPIKAFISFGSVLGYPTVRRYVTDPTGHTPFPPKLYRWINLYNEKDFATVVRDLAPLYLSNDSRKVEDHDVLGRSPSVTNLMAGHDPKVYLSSTVMGEAIESLLKDPNL